MSFDYWNFVFLTTTGSEKFCCFFVCCLKVRREKISERMRLLQELVPGCNKVLYLEVAF